MNSMLRYAGVMVLGVALAMSGAACAKRKSGPPPRPPVSVQTALAIQADVPVEISAFGSTEARASVDVVPQVSGQLLRTLFRDGAVVTNGQPLFQIDPSDYEVRVRQAEALVAADRVSLELSRGTVERSRPLIEQKLISAEDFDTLRTRMEVAASKLQMDEAALDQARLSLARCAIAAPLAGICSRAYVDDGNLVAAGQTRLTNIRSYDPIEVECTVSEQSLPVLRQAMARGDVGLEVTPQGETNGYAGKLVFVDNAVNSLSGTILLRGQIPNPELKLWARQFVQVRILADTVRDAVLVPEGAVQFGKRGPYLFVVTKDNLAEQRQIRIGMRHEGRIQVLEGVSAGEKVVTLGQLMLKLKPGGQVAEAAAVVTSGEK